MATRGAPLTVTTVTTAPIPAAPAPATAVVGRAQAAGAPAYVTQAQAHAIRDAATRTRDRLLVQTLWESGGRVSEVTRLRRADVDAAEGALVLENLKQRRRELRRKRVYVSRDLVGALLAYCTDARIGPTGYVFATGRAAAPRSMSRQLAWKLVTGLARRAGARVVDTATGEERPATGLDFRHGAAVHQLRAGVPLSEVSQQLGHARIDTTAVYTRLTDAERRRFADRVAW